MGERAARRGGLPAMAVGAPTRLRVVGGMTIETARASLGHGRPSDAAQKQSRRRDQKGETKLQFGPRMKRPTTLSAMTNALAARTRVSTRRC